MTLTKIHLYIHTNANKSEMFQYLWHRKRELNRKKKSEEYKLSERENYRLRKIQREYKRETVHPKDTQGASGSIMVSKLD